MKMKIKNNIEQTLVVLDTAEDDFDLREPQRMEIGAPQITSIEFFYEDLVSLSGVTLDPGKMPIMGFEQEEKEGVLLPAGLGMIFDKNKMLTITVDEGVAIPIPAAEEEE